MILAPQSITKSMYLFGVEDSHFKGMTNIETWQEKVRLGKGMIEYLNMWHRLYRDFYRIDSVVVAIKHNQGLITAMEFSEMFPFQYLYPVFDLKVIAFDGLSFVFSEFKGVGYE